MTATVLASVHWQRLDGPGEDSCRLVQEPQGYLLSGHARYVAAGQEIALDYLVRCDLNWRSTSADVAGLIDGGEVAWRITRDSQGWLLNGARQGLADCTDIDLAITPATNLLPLRRMDPEAQIAVAVGGLVPARRGRAADPARPKLHAPVATTGRLCLGRVSGPAGGASKWFCDPLRGPVAGPGRCAGLAA